MKKIPSSWTECELGEIIKYKKGKKPQKIENTPFENSLPYLDIQALEYGDNRRFVDKGSSNILDTDSIAIVWDGARSGWVAKGVHGAIGSTIASLTPKGANSNYLYYFLKSKFEYLNSNTRGTGIPHVDPSILWSLEFPLPPLSEQTRIVAKLDALFAHIVTLKAKLDRIPELIKNFRQQVLTQAVTGKLTEEWRKGKKLEEWKVVSSSNIFEFVTSGSRGWAQYYKETGKQLFVRITNMNFGNYNIDLSPSKLQFLDLPANSEGKRTLLQARDILISITADIGMISLVPEGFPFEAYVNQHVCLARPIKTINEKYLALFLMSEKGFGQLEERKRGMTKAGLTLGDIKNLLISIPAIEEQQEIVKRVEELFSTANKIEAQYQILKSKIDSLPQAILNKAFKGELVSQDQNDEPASVLLERIKREKGERK